MNYIQVTVQESNPEQQEIFVALLSDWPFESFSQEEKELQAFISNEFWSQSVQEEIEQVLKNRDFSIQEIKQENWNATWESNFKPIGISDKIIVRAEFHEPASGFETELIITPKMSFGTGHHQTTYLVLQELIDLPIEHKSVLDMGCGTGILGFYALKRGASSLVSIDNDEWAYENALENAKLNQVEASIICGGKEVIPKQQFDLVIANINKLILVDQIPNYAQALTDQGILLLSGFYTEDIKDLNQKSQQYGLSFVAYTSKDNWAMMRLTK